MSSVYAKCVPSKDNGADRSPRRLVGSCRVRLERELPGELDAANGAIEAEAVTVGAVGLRDGRSDHAEGGTAVGTVRIGEVRMVQEIESRHAHTERGLFTNAEIAEEVQIEIEVARSAEHIPVLERESRIRRQSRTIHKAACQQARRIRSGFATSAIRDGWCARGNRENRRGTVGH